MLPGYGELEGRTTGAVEEPVIESLHERGCSASVGRRAAIRFWRCKTPPSSASSTTGSSRRWESASRCRRECDGRMDAVLLLERMDDWLRNMALTSRASGISACRFPSHPCSCGH